MKPSEIEKRNGGTSAPPPSGHGALYSLAHLPEKAILDEKTLAHALAVSPRTVRRMVGRGELPPPVSLAGRAVWFAGRVLAHVEKKMERAEASAARRRSAVRTRQTP